MKITVELTTLDEILELQPLFDTVSQLYNPAKESYELLIDRLLIDDVLDLTTRSVNVLGEANIHNMKTLLSKTEADLLSLQNCGMKTLKEIQGALKAKGLFLKK